MDKLIDPLIADMQCEHEQALRDGRPWHRRWILLIGYVAFWKAVALHVPIWTRRIVRRWATSERGTAGGGLAAAAVTMIILTALFILPALPLSRANHKGQMAWLALLSVPQSVPLSLPIVLLVGVLCGLRNRMVTARIRHIILGIGLAGSLISFGAVNWLVPAANQAFRVSVAGRQVVRGPAELPLRSLREQALAMKNEGRSRKAGGLLLDYHLRGALAGAAMVFAVFGLGVTALRIGRAATAGIAIGSCVLYIRYIFELSNVGESVFSDERVALAVAWIPNLALILTSLTFLSVRHQTRLPDQPPQG